MNEQGEGMHASIRVLVKEKMARHMEWWNRPDAYILAKRFIEENKETVRLATEVCGQVAHGMVREETEKNRTCQGKDLRLDTTV